MVDQLRGVNLGGWLVLERWLTPSLFKGVWAKDEYGFSKELGEAAVERLKNHRETFISEEDFVWLQQQGINAVRLPVGYWLFGDEPPYVGGEEYVAKCFTWAEKYDINVLLDFHGLPGSQNGHDHSGRAGKVEWGTPETVDKSLAFVEKLGKTYGHERSLLGIEVANEPNEHIPHETLVDYYQRAYELLRHICKPDAVVVISDAYRPNDWQDTMTGTDYPKVWLDTHMYKVFGKVNERRNIERHLLSVKREWSKQLQTMSKSHPVIVGEWSLGLPARAFRGLDERERDLAMKAFATLQLEAFASTQGWFFWNYKSEDMAGWSLRDCIGRGWVNLRSS